MGSSKVGYSRLPSSPGALPGEFSSKSSSVDPARVVRPVEEVEMSVRKFEREQDCEEAGEQRQLIQGQGLKAYGSFEQDECIHDEKDELQPIQRSADGRTPLPKQLFFVIAMLFTEPMAYSQVYPYVNKMMVDIGVVVHPSQAGYYSGFLESIFAVSELCTVVLWGRIAEHIGRKPIILTCLTGVAVSTFLLGLSKSYPWALLMRGIAGSLSGNRPILQSIIGDITDETNEVVAYGYFGGALNVAEIVGPAIGKVFKVLHAAHFNDYVIAGIPLFRHFPYLLPCLICAIAMLGIVIVGTLFMKETPRKAVSGKHNEEDRRGILRVASFPPLRNVLFNYFMLTVMENSVFTVYSLYAYAPIQSGGLSRNPQEIGLAMAFCGTSGALTQILVLPYLQRKIGRVAVYRLSIILIPLTLLLFPFVNLIARHTVNYEGYHTSEGPNSNTKGYDNPPAGLAVWIGMVCIVFINRMICMGYPLAIMSIRDAAPSPSAAGTAYSVGHFVHCIALTIAPGLTSTLFSFSADSGWLGGNFLWVVMFIVSLYVVWSGFQMQVSN